jgi:hypothetical protein
VVAKEGDKVKTIRFGQQGVKGSPDGSKRNKAFKARHAKNISKFIDLCTMDPTEYEFASVIFGSWEIWERISNAPSVKPHVAKWRKEATIRRKAMAFKAVVSEVSEGGRSSFTAAKYLIEENWKDQGQTKDGRAARKEVRETASAAYERSAISEDLKRLKADGLIQ